MTVAQYIILVCWVVFLLYWIVGAWSVKPTQEAKRGFWSFRWIRWTLVGLILAFLLLRDLGLPVSAGALALSVIPPSALTTIISVIFVVGGLVIAILARRTLAGNWSSEVVLKRDQELITTGVYGYARHPIYTGVLLMALGSALWAGTILAFVLFLALLFFFWFKSKGEEELLTEHFPREYPAYKNRTKALIPYVF